MALSAWVWRTEKKEATAPVIKESSITNGIALVTFDHVAKGLKVCDASEDVLGFAMSHNGSVWVNATAEIVDQKTVKVYSHLLKDPKYVSYAYCDMNTDANLIASNGIPAAPFSAGVTDGCGLGSRAYLNCDEEVCGNEFCYG